MEKSEIIYNREKCKINWEKWDKRWPDLRLVLIPDLCHIIADYLFYEPKYFQGDDRGIWNTYSKTNVIKYTKYPFFNRFLLNFF